MTAFLVWSVQAAGRGGAGPCKGVWAGEKNQKTKKPKNQKNQVKPVLSELERRCFVLFQMYTLSKSAAGVQRVLVLLVLLRFLLMWMECKLCPFL